MFDMFLVLIMGISTVLLSGLSFLIIAQLTKEFYEILKRWWK